MSDTPTSTTPMNLGFDGDDDVVFDQGTVDRSSNATSTGTSSEVDWEPIELPKPCGIRPAYVADMKVVTPKDGSAPVLILSVQIVDAEFPVGPTNRPLDIRVQRTETTKLRYIAAALGIDYDDYKTEAGRAKSKGGHCRVFVTVYKDRLQVPNFMPSMSKKSENKEFFAHLGSIGIDETAYKKFYDGYCGLLPAA